MKKLLILFLFTVALSSTAFSGTKLDEANLAINIIRSQMAQVLNPSAPDVPTKYGNWLSYPSQSYAKFALLIVSGNPYITSIQVYPLTGDKVRIVYLGSGLDESGDLKGGFYNEHPQVTSFTDKDGSRRVKAEAMAGGFVIRDEVIDKTGKIISVNESNERYYYNCEPNTRGFKRCSRAK